jgi:hypothetical protein
MVLSTAAELNRSPWSSRSIAITVVQGVIAEPKSAIAVLGKGEEGAIAVWGRREARSLFVGRGGSAIVVFRKGEGSAIAVCGKRRKARSLFLERRGKLDRCFGKEREARSLFVGRGGRRDRCLRKGKEARSLFLGRMGRRDRCLRKGKEGSIAVWEGERSAIVV